MLMTDSGAESSNVKNTTVTGTITALPSRQRTRIARRLRALQRRVEDAQRQHVEALQRVRRVREHVLAQRAPEARVRAVARHVLVEALGDLPVAFVPRVRRGRSYPSPLDARRGRSTHLR